ncbi:sigma-70 family RNA polymerase sigma factor [Acidisoma cellulosilytica]|uniref:Sigma-70 family RNA polymerase sigma factor n=1 Tax=Acidisoma cellulosilyticum TaxID=2802395 RepID=A0A963Z666_9PROT|nr:sigma-70 family RNA polymerase sigma factor [Acidisoma cellulosilyticum]MCB8883594.1 sigma-70 family RNA polymerase sigma factor [Acidisoma cellulosilyticum]
MTSWADRLSRLFAAHQTRLESFVRRRTGDAQIAADLTQEAFVRFARMPDGETLDNPSGYLFTIAGNLAQDHNRRVSRWRRLDGGQVDDHHPSPALDAEAVVAARERDQLLQNAILALPERSRIMFLHFHVDGLSYQEIALRLQTTPRSVEYHLTRALALCRAHVQQAMSGGRRPQN